VMVCMDGFILTHAYEQVDLPSAEQADAFLPPYEPRQVLDPAEPVSIGAMVGPEAFTEVKYLAHVRQLQALEEIPELSRRLAGVLGREQHGLLRGYRLQDADTVVVALGSVLGTIEDAVDELRERGVAIGALGIKAFRPFPLTEVSAALGRAKRVVVMEKALALGVGGILSQNVRDSLAGGAAPIHTVIAGLGGRPIMRAALCRLFEEAIGGRLQPLTFLDLNRGLVERELKRTRAKRRSGPHAENILRDVGAIASGPV
jgi:pyruvate ferredoxin oxidoreductase alpha subunit